MFAPTGTDAFPAAPIRPAIGSWFAGISCSLWSARPASSFALGGNNFRRLHGEARCSARWRRNYKFRTRPIRAGVKIGTFLAWIDWKQRDQRTCNDHDGYRRRRRYLLLAGLVQARVLDSDLRDHLRRLTRIAWRQSS